ncbi:MAG: hypothetical protein QHC65_16345 [Sphingomonas sp.]|nr:hypothetical protein [Sphingomonas sp.]MDX3885995.1 hypothetical protein [Sphingomonas sp.]
MAFTQADLDALDRAILTGIRKVTFADGRSTEYQSVDEMRKVREVVKGEVALVAGRDTRRNRSIIARVGRCRR